MATQGTDGKAERDRDQWFSSTHWTTVLAACDRRLPEAISALEKLCQTYWYPLYAYVRRRGYSPQDAQDLTQGFFATLLEKDYLAQVDRQKGRFRSFLLGSLNHYLLDAQKRDQALKRGGGRAWVSLDEVTAEQRYAGELSVEATPEKAYERRWALTLLERVLGRLEAEYARAGKSAHLEPLRPFILGDTASPSYAEAASKLGLSEGAVRVAVHRLRQRYGALLRDEIAHTVNRPELVGEEINHLIQVLST